MFLDSISGIGYTGPMITDDESRLRKLERELYTTDVEPLSKRALMHDKKYDEPDDWVHNDEIHVSNSMTNHSDNSIFKKIFLGSLVIFAVAVVILIGSFMSGGGSISANNVDVAITTKAFVDGGESLPVDVTVTNRNRSAMELATLVLEYPSSNAGNVGAMARIDRDIGNLGAGDSHVESFSVQLYGEEGAAKQIQAHLEFRVVGSNVVYTKDASSDITIRTSPIRLTLDAPDKILPNQTVPLKFTIVGNGTATLSNVAFKVEYPAGFTFANANPAPSTGTAIWYLGDVPPGVNRTITVNGSFAGSVNDAITVRASVGAQNAKDENLLDQIYNTVAQVIPLTNAFIDAKLSVSGSANMTIPVGATQNVRVDVPWTNTTASRLTNIEIHVVLSGSAYDPSKLQTGSGFFNSSANEIVWTRQQDSNLSGADPAKSGTVSFSITPKSFSAGTSPTNPSIVMQVSVRAVDAGTVRTAANIDKKTLVVGSDLNLLARTMYYSGPIQNMGVMPPKHDTETTYTMEWQLTNSRNRVTGAKVSTLLPTNVAWKNVIVPQNENVSYNTVTRELIWNAGEVAAGATKTVSIKVGVTPSSSQVGGPAPLTDTIAFTGHDTFTNTDISLNRRGLDTRTLNDGAGPGAQGAVQ